jgi:hypothetical protein
VDRHPFDPIALVFGLLLATAGMIVLLGGSLADDGAFLAPVGLIALGLALLYQARHRRDPAEPAPTDVDVTSDGEPSTDDADPTDIEGATTEQGLAGEHGPGHEVGAERGEDG